MRKFFLITFLGLFFSSSLFGIEIPNPLKWERIEQFVDALINFVWQVALALAPLLIIVGGFYMVTSAGNVERIETGKKIILYTIVGLLIILLAKATINFLIEQMGVQGDERTPRGDGDGGGIQEPGGPPIPD